jgi:hypothetical protein
MALKRKQDSFEQDRELLLNLVSALRQGGDRHVAQLLALIKSDASFEEIKLCIETQLGELYQAGERSSPELEEISQEIDRRLQEMPSSSRRRVLDVTRISDRPLFHVPARPWTDVTDDNDLVSHLISVWFTWQHPWNHWIDREEFITAMQRGDRGSKFCSRFLVNAMLAEACVSHVHGLHLFLTIENSHIPTTMRRKRNEASCRK